MIVVIVIAVVVVSTIALSAILYVMVSGLITNGPPSPIAVGVVVGRSSDGTNWTLTFTSVPTNMNPSVTYLSLMTGSGAMAMPQTALSSMGGGMTMMSSGMGSLWVHYSGTSGAMIAAGDTISIGTMTSMGTSTTGFQGRMLFAASLVWSGTLQ